MSGFAEAGGSLDDEDFYVSLQGHDHGLLESVVSFGGLRPGKVLGDGLRPVEAVLGDVFVELLGGFLVDSLRRRWFLAVFWDDGCRHGRVVSAGWICLVRVRDGIVE